MALLTRDQQIGVYTVQSLIKENVYTETYRVEDEDGNPFFLKLFVIKRMPEKLMNAETGIVSEIENSKKMKHKNIISFINCGTINSIEGECQYYVTEYFSGELLAEKILREGKIGVDEAMSIFRSVLEGLNYMHSQGLYHNDITPRNIMLSATADGIPEIIDLGHISNRCTGNVPFDTSDLDIFYSANETYGGIYDEQSDIFSATAVLYTMITGSKPWNMEFADSMKRTRRAMLLKEKRKEEPLPIANIQVDECAKAILAKGLAVTYDDRYRSIGQTTPRQRGT